MAFSAHTAGRHLAGVERHLAIANTCIIHQLHSIAKLDCCGADLGGTRGHQALVERELQIYRP
jgi:hypothetical protein